jgi:hypothetical protein
VNATRIISEQGEEARNGEVEQTPAARPKVSGDGIPAVTAMTRQARSQPLPPHPAHVHTWRGPTPAMLEDGDWGRVCSGCLKVAR